jgi:hypothetical protein
MLSSEQFQPRHDFSHLALGVALKRSESVYPAIERTDSMDLYGYDIFPIEDTLGTLGKNVFMVMHQGGSSEPIEVTGGVGSTLWPILGRGVLLQRHQYENAEVKVSYLDAARPIEFVMDPGEASMLINIAEEPFAVRNDSWPDYFAANKAVSNDPDLLRVAARYGIEAADK